MILKRLSLSTLASECCTQSLPDKKCWCKEAILQYLYHNNTTGEVRCWPGGGGYIKGGFLSLSLETQLVQDETWRLNLTSQWGRPCLKHQRFSKSQCAAAATNGILVHWSMWWWWCGGLHQWLPHPYLTDMKIWSSFVLVILSINYICHLLNQLLHQLWGRFMTYWRHLVASKVEA